MWSGDILATSWLADPEPQPELADVFAGDEVKVNMVHTKIKISQNRSTDTEGVVNYCPPRKTGETGVCLSGTRTVQSGVVAFGRGLLQQGQPPPAQCMGGKAVVPPHTAHKALHTALATWGAASPPRGRACGDRIGRPSVSTRPRIGLNG